MDEMIKDDSFDKDMKRMDDLCNSSSYVGHDEVNWKDFPELGEGIEEVLSIGDDSE